MADVLNRETLEFRRSVNTPDFDPAQWILNPDLSAVAGHPKSHWAVQGDAVMLRTEPDRDTADLAAARAEKLADIDEWWDRQALQGIDVGSGVRLRSSSLDAAQLQALLIALAGAPDEFPTLVSDVNGMPVVTTAGEFRGLAIVYENEFSGRRALWATLKLAVSNAASIAAVNAVEIP